MLSNSGRNILAWLNRYSPTRIIEWSNCIRCWYVCHSSTKCFILAKFRYQDGRKIFKWCMWFCQELLSKFLWSLMNMYIWASPWETLSSGLLTKRVSNQSLQLQRLVRKMKFTSSKLTYDTYLNVNNKGADQTARMRRLVCTFVVRKPPKTAAHISSFVMHAPVRYCLYAWTNWP